MPGKQDMRTPRWLFELIQLRLGVDFVLDAAAQAHNTLCERFYDESANGLEQPWLDATFCNPPFARVGDWVSKAATEARRASVRSAMLVPTGCSQAWFHEMARHWLVLVPDKRISFELPDGTPTKGADRDTMIVCFGPGFENPFRDHFWAQPFGVGQ